MSCLVATITRKPIELSANITREPVIITARISQVCDIYWGFPLYTADGARLHSVDSRIYADKY